MINEENLNKMYEGLIAGKELTTKELTSYGFNSKDLFNLVENGILERVKRGHYSFHSINDLFYYGKGLIKTKEFEKATACFLKCYELNPNHLWTCVQLFLRSVQEKDYEMAFKYFKPLYDSKNHNYVSNSNCYLYLLNMITEVPEKYRQRAKSLKFEDIGVNFDDKRYRDKNLQNEIISSIFNQKFVVASKQLNKIIEQRGKATVQEIIIITLLSQAIDEQIKNKKDVVVLMSEKQYDEVIKYLETIKRRHKLSDSDELVLSLAKELTDMMKTGLIPEKQVLSTDNLFNAILGKNYELALSFSEKYVKRNNLNPQDNVMYMLLNDIVETIHSLSKTEDKQKIDVAFRPDPTNTFKDTLANIQNDLMNQDLDNAFRTLKNYLDHINKKEYEFLIVNLIKISVREQDNAFTKPMMVLMHMSKENFEVNILEYIQNFYKALSQNNFEEAKIYLDIISKLNNLKQTCTFIDSLEQVLNATEKLVNKKRNSEVLTRVEQSLEPNISSVTISQKPTPKLVVPKQEKTKIDSKSIVIKPQKETEIINNTEVELINSKLDRLYRKGIVLLTQSESKKIKDIHAIINNMPDVAYFTIGEEEETQIVLRFKPNNGIYVDISQVTKEGEEAYAEKDYNVAINKFRRLLEVGNPPAWIYAKLGLSYMLKYDKKTAIDYLTIATELSKNNRKNKFEFTELIDHLTGESERKPRVAMNVSDFKNDIEDYYGIENIEELAHLISSGIEMNEACASLGINEEQQTIAELIFARECYFNENYTLGDRYLKKVERTKNKSKFVKSLFEEIKKNRMFYKNRRETDHKPLTLTPKRKNI